MLIVRRRGKMGAFSWWMDDEKGGWCQLMDDDLPRAMTGSFLYFVMLTLPLRRPVDQESTLSVSPRPLHGCLIN